MHSPVCFRREFQNGICLICDIISVREKQGGDNMNIDLLDYGYTAPFQAMGREYPDLSPARVILQEKGMYRIVSSLGESLAVISGKLRYEAHTAEDLPAVGDFVMAEIDESGNNSVIHAVLNRKSVFIRKSAGTANAQQIVAANIDRLFLCMSLNQDFNIRRLERYLSVAWESGAVPVVVLTKADLCEDLSSRLSEVDSVAFGADVAVVSAHTAGKYTELERFLKPRETIALLGSSGVGKSTIINYFLGSDVIRTNGLRNDDKGRHTTTHRELIRLKNGGLLIDTPGMRELGMWDSAEGIDMSFRDVEELAQRCRFRNCTHEKEPGCAVRDAIRSGILQEERLASYKKLKAENAYSQDSEKYLAEKQKKFKDIAKRNKEQKKSGKY